MALRENTKNKQVTFWVTEQEKADLHALAKALDMDVSKTIRYGLRLAKAAQR